MSPSSIEAEVVEVAIVEEESAAADSAAMDVDEYRRLREVSRHRWLLAGSILVLLLALVLSVRNETSVVLPVVEVPLPELCMARIWAGVPCPGCGMTRCFISAVQGDLAMAWHFNPAGLLALGGVALQIPYRSYRLLCLARGRQGWEFSVVSCTVIYCAFAALLLIQWIARLFVTW